jgi:D-glycero-alpha-D-manno-heptose-7-phosphate kinase
MTPIRVSAPTRIADLGGWTDTWFAGHGVVCHLAVWPGVEVTLSPCDGPAGVEVRLRNFDREWHWTPGTPPQVCPDPLIGACLDESEIPDGAWLLDVGSAVPPGASMGTSASVCVAVLAALDRLRRVPLDPAVLALRAHAVETRRLGQQSGIQDQWAAAAGGINLITMDVYPHARCESLAVADDTRHALEAQLLVVLLERGHDSSAVHELVVRQLSETGPGDARLEVLRRCARDGAEALRAGDLRDYGATLTRNTEAQAALHPSLVNDEARAIIATVTGSDALGVKVNGAGGAGGSLTVLTASPEARARLVTRLAADCPGARVLDVTLALDVGDSAPSFRADPT